MTHKKPPVRILLAIILTVSSFLATTAFTKEAGPGGSGGGNGEEGDFTSSARAIYSILNSQPDLTRKILGITAITYLGALDSTKVQCSFGAMTAKMRSLNKTAYFDRNSNSIYLDCENYPKLKNSGEEKTVVVFHEYMRKLSLEESDYKISSNLPAALKQIAFSNKILFTFKITGKAKPFKAFWYNFGPELIAESPELPGKRLFLNCWSGDNQLNIRISEREIKGWKSIIGEYSGPTFNCTAKAKALESASVQNPSYLYIDKKGTLISESPTAAAERTIVNHYCTCDPHEDQRNPSHVILINIFNSGEQQKIYLSGQYLLQTSCDRALQAHPSCH